MNDDSRSDKSKGDKLKVNEISLAAEPKSDESIFTDTSDSDDDESIDTYKSVESDGSLDTVKKSGPSNIESTRFNLRNKPKTLACNDSLKERNPFQIATCKDDISDKNSKGNKMLRSNDVEAEVDEISDTTSSKSHESSCANASDSDESLNKSEYEDEASDESDGALETIISPSNRLSTLYNLKKFGKKRNPFTNDEKAAIKKGVEKFDIGNWSRIKSHYNDTLKDRSTTQIKDAYRTMQRQEILDITESNKMITDTEVDETSKSQSDDILETELNETPVKRGISNRNSKEYNLKKYEKKRKPFTSIEKAAIKRGIERFGVGKWSVIKNYYHNSLRDRSTIQIKDAFRTMKRNGNLSK